jgi:transcriptional regulator with XRE-family HTH domain
VPTNADLGQAIRRLRWDRNLSIEDLAHAADVHPTYLGRIERGGASPTWGKITNLARALGVPLTVLLQATKQEAEVARVVRDARARLKRVERGTALGDPDTHLPNHCHHKDGRLW